MKFRSFVFLALVVLFVGCNGNPLSNGGVPSGGSEVAVNTTDVSPTTPNINQGQFYFGTIQFILMAFMVYYFLVLSPERQKLESQEKFIKGLKKGDDVVTSGGILGKVSNVSDDAISVDCGNNIKLRVLPKNVHSLRAAATSGDSKGGIAARNK